MRSRLAALEATYFNPDRGSSKDGLAERTAIEKWGGYWGPFICPSFSFLISFIVFHNSSWSLVSLFRFAHMIARPPSLIKVRRPFGAEAIDQISDVVPSIGKLVRFAAGSHEPMDVAAAPVHLIKLVEPPPENLARRAAVEQQGRPRPH